MKRLAILVAAVLVGTGVVVHGCGNGTLVNNGGRGEIRGTVTHPNANSGQKWVHGTVQRVSGRGAVHYLRGATVAGVRIAQNR